MDFKKIVQERRSIKYLDANHKMTKDETNELFKMTLLSPTAFNIQHWRFDVIENKELREEIKKIIRTFKKASVPKKNSTDDAKSGVFISAPDIFQLAYMKGNSPHPFLNKFIPAALVNMNVNYTGSNTYATYHDGTPVHITMQLDFQELNPIYFEDYEALEKAKDTSVGY